MSHATQDLEYHQGNSIPLKVTVTDRAGVAVDISSATEIRFALAGAATDAAPLFSKTKSGGDITFETDGSDGVFMVDLDAVDTSSLDGEYHYEADVNMAELETVVTGTFQVIASVLN